MVIRLHSVAMTPEPVIALSGDGHSDDAAWHVLGGRQRVRFAKRASERLEPAS
jgi:hypothetical protein